MVKWMQETLNEGIVSVRLSTFVLTSLDQFFYIDYIIYFIYKTSELSKEVNGTEPSPSNSHLWG